MTNYSIFIKNCIKTEKRNEFSLMREWLRLQKNFIIENDTKCVNPINFYKSFAQNINRSEYTFVGFEKVNEKVDLRRKIAELYIDVFKKFDMCFF